MTGITDVYVAAGRNKTIRYMLDGTTLIVWVGEMVDQAPADAHVGEIGGEGDSYAITIVEPETPNHIMMPKQPHLLQ